MRFLFRLIRTVFLLGLLALVVLVAYAYWTGSRPSELLQWPGGSRPNVTAARERGAAIAGEAAKAVGKVDETLSDSALTAKIKSKMALDDYVRARDIHVETADGVVTLSGVVASSAERARAIRLARETKGVKSVHDRLEVRSQ